MHRLRRAELAKIADPVQRNPLFGRGGVEHVVEPDDILVLVAAHPFLRTNCKLHAAERDLHAERRLGAADAGIINHFRNIDAALQLVLFAPCRGPRRGAWS